MTTFTRIVGSSTALAAMLVPAAAMAGGDLTRADFDRCNQQAMLAAGVSGAQMPSASPSTSGGSISTAPSTGATSGTGVSTSSPSGNTVSSPATGSVSPPSASGGVSSPSASGAVTAPSGASASGSHDAQLDRAVQAYRACLQR